MQKVVLATGNAGKVRELASLLNDFGLNVVAQTDLGVESAEETGLTLQFTPEDRRHAWQSLFGAEHSLYEVLAPVDVQIVISWEHEAYVWMTEEELVAHEAVDAFMHRAQEWLSIQVDLQNSQTVV